MGSVRLLDFVNISIGVDSESLIRVEFLSYSFGVVLLKELFFLLFEIRSILVILLEKLVEGFNRLNVPRLFVCLNFSIFLGCTRPSGHCFLGNVSFRGPRLPKREQRLQKSSAHFNNIISF